MQNIEFIPLSESATLLSFGKTIDLATHETLMDAKTKIEANPFIGFTETVPAYNSLAVYFNPVEIKAETESIFITVMKQLKQILTEEIQSGTLLFKNLIIEIPVCYDDEYGIDLQELSQQLKLTKEEIIQFHISQLYKIFMIGFTPGFPYMGILNEKLFTKRKQQPRTSVPEGSIAIAGNQTGIYPLSTPGGWNIIGRTSLKLFDKEKENPFLLKAGDTVKFIPVSGKEIKELSVVTNSDKS
jgi:inhibitor of KinA